MKSASLIFVTLTIGAAHAASFDCAKAKTAQERAICAHPQLSAADDRMAAAYKNALAATPIGMIANVRADQQAWRSQVVLECPQGRKRFGQDMVACLRQTYDQRTKELRLLVQYKAGVTFVWRSLVLMNREEPKSDESEQDATNEIDVIPGYGTLAVSWPQTNVASPEWQAWNKAILLATERLASQNDPPEDGHWHPDWADDDDGDLKVTIGAVNSQIVASSIDRWGWRGAHPWEESIQFNWLLKERRELKPEDVFETNSPWDQVIQQHCMRNLVKDFGPHYESSYSGANGLPDILHRIIQDPENWQLSRMGLSIVFQDYAIAPRMLHPGPVIVPWNDLKPYLNPRFLIPR